MPFLTSMCTRNTHDAQANMQAKTAHTNKVNKTKMSFYLGWFFKSNPRLHIFGTSLELSHGEMGWGSLVTSSHTGWLATNTVGFLCFLMEKSSLISELPCGEDPSSMIQHQLAVKFRLLPLLPSCFRQQKGVIPCSYMIKSLEIHFT